MVDWFLSACQLHRFLDHFMLAIRTFKVATEKGTEKQIIRNAHERNHGQTMGEPVHANELMLHQPALAFYVRCAGRDKFAITGSSYNSCDAICGLS